MELQEAMKLIKNAVKNAGTIDQKHIDLTLVPADERSKYEEALRIVKNASKDGQISWENVLKGLDLN